MADHDILPVTSFGFETYAPDVVVDTTSWASSLKADTCYCACIGDHAGQHV